MINEKLKRKKKRRKENYNAEKAGTETRQDK